VSSVGILIAIFLFFPTLLLAQTSAGAQQRKTIELSSSGQAIFKIDGQVVFSKSGGAGGGRGFNVGGMDLSTGELLEPVRNFDTWGSRRTGVAHNALVDYVNGLPDETLVMIVVADEAGLTSWSGDGCASLPYYHIANVTNLLESLGSTRIRDYCYGDEWALMAIKGRGVALAEEHGGRATGAGIITISYEFVLGYPIADPEPEWGLVEPFESGNLLEATSDFSAPFSRNSEVFYIGGRGFNVAAFDPVTVELLGVRGFDTWGSRHSGTQHYALMDYIDAYPDGTLLMIAVADEAGLNNWSGTACHLWWGRHASETRTYLEILGSRMIRNYCYRDRWAMITYKGSGVAVDEAYSPDMHVPVSVRIHLESSSLYVGYDLINNLYMHKYFDGAQIYENLANGTTDCGPYIWNTCGWINDHHAHVIEFESAASYRASGMSFRGRLDAAQREQMLISLNSAEPVFWSEAETPVAGEDRWLQLIAPGIFQVSQGTNRLELYTPHFPATDSPDGSIHFEESAGERAVFAFYQSSGDADGDGLADSGYRGEDQNGDGIIDPLGSDGIAGTFDDETDPFNADTDGDGFSDFDERNADSDPNNQGVMPGLGPVVTHIAPAEGSVEHSEVTEIVVTFDRPVSIDAARIAEGFLTQSNNYPVSGTVSLSSDGLTLVFAPSERLAPSAQFYVRIERGVEDATAGGVFMNKFSSTFATDVVLTNSSAGGDSVSVTGNIVPITIGN
jgi:hypothetical protein